MSWSQGVGRRQVCGMPTSQPLASDLQLPWTMQYFRTAEILVRTC